jgi:26S proteasome regulatory subunit N2
MINTANSLLALLESSNIKMKEIAINKIESIIDVHWAEISDHIKTFENLFSTNETNQKEQVALILSKLYFNLEEYENAIDWALEARTKFNYTIKSPFTSTILRKILEKYISIKKHNFFNQDNLLEIEERIQNLVIQIFHNCLDSKEYKQALGFCIESYDLGRVSAK